MTNEDDAKPRSPLLKELKKEDISTHSKAELTDRINLLKAEIDRAETAIKDREASRAAAEAIFKN